MRPGSWVDAAKEASLSQQQSLSLTEDRLRQKRRGLWYENEGEGT